jgi:hypothetical protein
MTDLYIWPDSHLSAPIKETINYKNFDLLILENGEHCAIYPSGVLYSKLTQKEIGSLIERDSNDNQT